MMEDNGQKSSQDFWSKIELKIMLDFISENYKKWCGNKNKVYEDLAKAGILVGRDINQIRNKMNKLRVKYFDERKECNRTGASPSVWEWYNRLDELYGHKENADPSYLSDSLTINKDIEKESEDEVILINDVKVKEEFKKNNNNSKRHKPNIVDTLSNAIVSMNESKEKFFDKKLDLHNREMNSRMELERYKVEQKMELKRIELEIQKQKLEIEKLNAENTKKKLELEEMKLKK
jgi:hypothetical protein